MMSAPKKPGASARAQGLWVCLGAYLTAAAAAQLTAWAVHGRHPILVAGTADLAAMIVVFLFSLAFNNSSLYDPYWSVAPVFIALYWLLRAGAAYWPISFFGFHLLPTALVFLGCLPLLPALSAARPFSALDAAAAAVSAGAILIEALADRQLARFRLEALPGQIMDSGLWAFSRHPNYFGEVLFWWGLWLFSLAAAPSWAWTAAGPAAITALFLRVSIPMMERHLLRRRPQYAEHRRRRSALVPWFPRSAPKRPA